jgi:hypothetical protein
VDRGDRWSVDGGYLEAVVLLQEDVLGLVPSFSKILWRHFASHFARMYITRLALVSVSRMTRARDAVTWKTSQQMARDLTAT